MNFSFVIKSILLSFLIFIILFAISFVSSQKILLDNSNYSIRTSVKEAINVGEYGVSGEITFDEKQLFLSIINNYLNENKIKVDEVDFEISVDEDNDIIVCRIFTKKDLFNQVSNVDYTFSYQIRER